MNKMLSVALNIVNDGLGEGRKNLSEDDLNVLCFSVYAVMNTIRCSEDDIRNALLRIRVISETDKDSFLDGDYYSQIICLLRNLLCLIRYDKDSKTELKLLKGKDSIKMGPVKQDHSFQEEGIITFFIDFCRADIMELEINDNKVLNSFREVYKSTDSEDIEYSQAQLFITELCLDPVILRIITDSFGTDKPVLETKNAFNGYKGENMWDIVAEDYLTRRSKQYLKDMNE